jgi:phage-related minor tail protein
MLDGKAGVEAASGELADSAKSGVEAAADSLEQSGKSLFREWVTGAKSASEALGGLASRLADMLADSAFDSLFGKDGGIFGGIWDGISSAFGFAKGGVFQGGHVQAFADGGVVARATNFAMPGGRMGLMGEAGPEAIMPLTRGPGGRLGVESHGGGGTVRLIIEEGPMFAARVEAISGDTAVEVVRGYDAEVAPASRNRNPREVG